ncbi:MAG: MEDS domain-containing protein [Trebonia sp.]
MQGSSGQSAVVGHRDHAVQFYGDDEELSASVGRFLSEGLSVGGAAVAVATGGHRDGFVAGLAVTGTDAAATRSAGRLVMVDAAVMLDSFLAGNRIDGSRFAAVAGSLIGRAAAAGQPVRIYAELVALLWDAGQVALALELEEMWNDLASRLPFELLCGYPARLWAGREDTGPLEQVCRLHTGVIAPHPGLPGVAGVSVSGREAMRSFPHALDSARAAREFVLDRLGSRVGEPVAVDAAIVTAELAANALLHAHSAFTVAVSQVAAGVRIAVRDAAPLPDSGGVLLRPRPGHGLDIVAKIADRWAVEPLPDGKVIWAELPASPREPG